MKINIWIVLVILLVAVGGYILAFIQYDNNIELQTKMLSEDLDKIGIIDEELSRVRKSKEVTVDDLKKSKERLDKIINEAEKRNKDSLSVEDALRIIEDN